MLKGRPKSLSELLGGQDNPLGNLASEARLRENLGDHLRKHLPPALGAGFLHCNLRNETTLVVIAATPEWASRLRFEEALFIRLCAEHGTRVTAVKVRVGTL
jgi:hypothetical protein